MCTEHTNLPGDAQGVSPALRASAEPAVDLRTQAPDTRPCHSPSCRWEGVAGLIYFRQRCAGAIADRWVHGALASFKEASPRTLYWQV